jgi:carbamoylphosphate synthase small subunit
MEIINIEARTFEAMMAKFEAFVERIDTLCNTNGEKTLQKWLDNQDVCNILGISKRTLQTYRDNGTLAHTRVAHKMYYLPKDVEHLIHKLKNQ